jgi:hypothetical protein
MFGLFVSLAILGLSAIDPIGIAAMPILLAQKNPLARSLTFLGGSLVSLMLIGILFAQGFGKVMLVFETDHTWFVPSIEATAGLILLVIAGVVFWRIKTGETKVEPSKTLAKSLKLGRWQLFMGGALLVTIQSIVDVVFVVAMLRIGQLHVSNITLLAAVATYALAALALQFAVVATYLLAPPAYRAKTLDSVHKLLEKHASQALVGVSLLLGCTLLAIAA